MENPHGFHMAAMAEAPAPWEPRRSAPEGSWEVAAFSNGQRNFPWENRGKNMGNYGRRYGKTTTVLDFWRLKTVKTTEN